MAERPFHPNSSEMLGCSAANPGSPSASNGLAGGIARHGHSQATAGRRRPVRAQGRHPAGMLQQQRPELGQGLASGGPQRLALALALFPRGEPPRSAGLLQPRPLSRTAEAPQVGHGGKDQEVVGIDTRAFLFHLGNKDIRFSGFSVRLVINRVQTSQPTTRGPDHEHPAGQCQRPS